MANLTIAQLTQILAAGVDNADLLPLWDDTAQETKKITIAQFKTLIAAVESVGATSPLSSTGGLTPTISISQSGAATDGYLSSTDWNTFNSKQGAITLTTTGTSGAATLIGNTLNIPNYASGGAVNWSEAFSSATQATSQWTPNNAAANVNAAITPKGTGALVAQIPTGTTVGGNARGSYAVDWQMVRNNANQVASGNLSFIGAGLNNISGVEGGVIGGGATNAAYAYSVIGGGTGNTANTAVAAASGAVTLTSGSTFVSGYPAGIEAGMLVVGTGIPAGTYITSLASPNFNISQNATVTGSQTLTFYRGYSCIVGGGNNTLSGSRQFIGGGFNNTVGTGVYNTIVAGVNNIASGGTHNFVGGGDGNYATGLYDVVGGGYQNRVQGTDNGNGRFIGGGFSNSIPGGQTNYSVITGGSSNTIGIGVNSVIGGGLSNTVNNAWATISGGRSNTVSGTYTFIGAGQSNTASATYSSVLGGLGGVASLYGQQAYGAGGYTVAGDAQSHELIWRRLVTGTTITELFLDGASAAAILPATNTIWQGTIEIAAICSVQGNGTTPVGNSQGTTYKVTIKRIGTTTTLVGTVQEIGTMNNDPTVVGTFTIDANDTNESLRIQFTPPATAGSTTVHRVVATFRGLQIQY